MITENDDDMFVVEESSKTKSKKEKVKSKKSKKAKTLIEFDNESSSLKTSPSKASKHGSRKRNEEISALLNKRIDEVVGQTQNLKEDLENVKKIKLLEKATLHIGLNVVDKAHQAEKTVERSKQAS